MFKILETERLVLRHLSVGQDEEFILRLLNEPSFLQYIGDKKVRNLADAGKYLVEGPIASYEKNGFGLFLVQLKDTLESVGICGLLKRESLPDVDVGFAFLPEFWNKGYAFESAAAVLDYGRDALHLDRIVAITDPTNEASARLLEKLGLQFERMITSEKGEQIKLFTPVAGS